MGPLPKIHKRERVTNEAANKLRIAIADATRGLTEGESLRIVNQVCSEWIGTMAKYHIRIERHDDPDKAGGLE